MWVTVGRNGICESTGAERDTVSVAVAKKGSEEERRCWRITAVELRW